LRWSFAVLMAFERSAPGALAFAWRLCASGCGVWVGLFALAEFDRGFILLLKSKAHAGHVRASSLTHEEASTEDEQWLEGLYPRAQISRH
jgi:ABC-type phosphate/phosphonate transport system permease subunit